jgi:predicted small lipoprotein YifL
VHRRRRLFAPCRTHSRRARPRRTREALSVRSTGALLATTTLAAPGRQGPLRAPQTLAHPHRRDRARHGASRLLETPPS